MSTVTNIVNRLLIEDRKNIIDIDSPDKAYDALQNSDLFEAPSIRLKRILCKLLNEKEENLITTLANAFYQFQIAQGRPYTLSRANGRAGKWLEKNSVPERETVFEICFSLQEKLKSVDAVKELITTGFGEHGFNVRSAKECVYFYCFASEKSYTDAQRILDEYSKAKIGGNNESKYRVESGKGDTTLLLRMQLFNNEWDSEGDFLEFLVQNKALFIEYSRSFLREYESLYNQLSQKVILYSAEKKLRNADNADAYFRIVKHSAPDAIRKNDELKKLYSEYAKAKKEVVEGKKLEESLKEFFAENEEKLLALWEQAVVPTLKEGVEPLAANQMELLVSAGIPKIKCEERAKNYNRGEKRHSSKKELSIENYAAGVAFNSYEKKAVNKASALSQTKTYGVMAQFPQRKNIRTPKRLYEVAENATGKNIFEPLHYRKLLLLMLYYNYFFAAFCPLDDRDGPQYFDFRKFVREVTEILYRCDLAPLYRNEYFDWLILNSAAAIVNGCIPSTLLDGILDDEVSDDGDESDRDILEWIATAMEAKDWKKWVCSAIKEASDGQTILLYRLLFGSKDGNVDKMRAKMLAAAENEDAFVIEKLEDISDGLIDFSDGSMGEPISYEETLDELRNNRLNFFGQVLRISYGF